MSKELMVAPAPEKRVRVVTEHELSVIEQVVMQGDLSKLNPEQRVIYYHKVCESSGLNPYTRPFEYISLNGKLTLYTRKDATEQLRKINGISITELESKVIDDLYIVKAVATTRDGRTDQATGAVTISNLKGENKANAIMKAETKAKRRVTLSISGMGWTDESEVDSIPNATKVDVDLETGEIKTSQAVQTINIQPEVDMTNEARESFYNNFSDDKQLTRAYINMCMERGFTETKAIQGAQKNPAAFDKWRAKQHKPGQMITIPAGQDPHTFAIETDAPSIFEEGK